MSSDRRTAKTCGRLLRLLAGSEVRVFVLQDILGRSPLFRGEDGKTFAPVFTRRRLAEEFRRDTPSPAVVIRPIGFSQFVGHLAAVEREGAALMVDWEEFPPEAFAFDRRETVRELGPEPCNP